MKQYHKINSIFKRDPDNNHKTFLTGQFSQPEYEFLQSNVWVGTEKIDGTNIRVMWDGDDVKFGGKTDNAMLPAPLLEHLNKQFPRELLKSVFEETPVCLYGEGYGGSIQKGSGYQEEQRFILFDVLASCEPVPVWLKRGDIKDIALEKLNIPVVPRLYEGPLLDCIQMVADGFYSCCAQDKKKKAEGLVLRPLMELRDRMGRRIITKVKTKDFALR